MPQAGRVTNIWAHESRAQKERESRFFFTGMPPREIRRSKHQDRNSKIARGDYAAAPVLNPGQSISNWVPVTDAAPMGAKSNQSWSPTLRARAISSRGIFSRGILARATLSRGMIGESPIGPVAVCQRCIDGAKRSVRARAQRQILRHRPFCSAKSWIRNSVQSHCYCTENRWTVCSLSVSPGESNVDGNDGLFGASG